uniref:Candidate secreted effector n=1 Tax=Meloidogyne incognita TaxID=6306 RepID=A0A914M239_MELIC
MPRNILYFIHNTRRKRLFMKRCFIDIVPSKRTKGVQKFSIRLARKNFVRKIEFIS